MQNNQTQRRSAHPVIWVVLILLFIFLSFSVLLNFGLGMGLLARKAPSISMGRPVDEKPKLEEVWSFGGGKTKVVRISLQGVITREQDEGWFAPSFDKIEMILNQIRVARNDRHVKAIIMEVDSPGGGITPSDEIYAALLAFKQSRDDRRVVVFTRDLMASGGYYVAAAGDLIMAEPTAVIGSISAIMQTLNWHELSNKIGVTDVTIKSGENKDLLNPFREVSTNQVVLLQEIIDDMYQRFVDIVASSRGLSSERMETIADGRIFSAEDALAEGLIDRIGYWEDTMEATAELLGVQQVRVMRYQMEVDFWTWFLETALPLNQWGRLGNIQERVTPRLLYQWGL